MSNYIPNRILKRIPISQLGLLLCLTLTCSGCASLTNRERILIGTAAGVIAGGTIGYLATPKDGTSSLGHAAMWGGIGGVATGVTGLFVFDEQKRSSELERELLQFKKELAKCPKRALVGEYDVNSGKPLPEHLKPFVKPEKVREYAVDVWIDKNGDEENPSQYHCDKEIEYEPGVFRRLRNSESNRNSQ